MRTMTQIQKSLNQRATETESRVHKKGALIHKKARKRLESVILSYFVKYGDGKKIEPRRLFEQADRTDYLARFDELNRLHEEHPDIVQKPKKRMTVQDLLAADILLCLFDMGDEEASCIAPALTDFAVTSLKAFSELVREKLTKRELKATAKKMAQEPLAGKTPEESVYAGKARLAEKISTGTALMVVRGEYAMTTAEYFGKLLEKRARKELDRLVYTENTFLIEQAPVLLLGNDFSEYEYVSMDDARVCDICKGLNGKVYRLSDQKPGLNAPPMHPWCRCRIRMYVKDGKEWIEKYMRFHGCSEEEAEDVLYHATE